MSHKHIREEGKINSSSKNLPVVSKCLAVVLIPKTRSNSGNNIDNDETHIDSSDGNVIQSSQVQKALSPCGYNGKELLNDFKIRNKTCYWNPSLVESIKSLEYKGFVEPSTILVTGGDIHLENLRSAWGRRVLKAPAGFTIERIGDVNGIQMQVIPQTQFMPLPDALCSIIMDLNMRRIMATLDVILEKLSQWYKDMTVPTQQLVFDTLANLIKDRKVFHTGSGYFVVTPDTNRLQSINNSYLPTNASWLPYHPMYVPVFQGQVGQQPPLLPSRAHMRSISCQVTTIEESSEEEDLVEKVKAGSTGKSSRSSSLARSKELKDEKKHKTAEKKLENIGELKRSSSIKYKGEKGKAVKDVNLKSSNINQEKEKGEKTSIFSKIFGRKKKDKDKALMPPPPPPPPVFHPVVLPSVPSNSDATSEGKEPKDKEYATFSAQFPPPEWLWYQQQLEKQKRTESWVTVVTHQTTKVSAVLQSSKVTTLPPTGARPTAINDQRYLSAKRPPVPLNQQNVDYMSMNAIGRLKDKNPTSESEFVKPRPLRPDNLYESFRNPKHHHHHRKSTDFDKLDEEKKQHLTSEYDVIDHGDVTPCHDSNVYHSVSALSPVAHLSDESTYAKLIEQPKLGPLHSTPRYDGQNDRTTYRVEGHEARDRIYGPPNHPHKRKSHRSRRRAQRMYSYYGQGDDISYEYKGRLPTKNSSTLQSRDSGVNCVGLGVTEEQAKRPGAPLYENTQLSNKNNLHQSIKNQVNPYRVHFEENENPQYLTDPAMSSVYQSDVTNPAYNSVVYGSNVTDMVGGPSVVYHTITNSNIETSDMPIPQNSLQSAFYDDSSVAVPAGKIMTFRADINFKAPLMDEKPEKLDSVVDIGSASTRDISGCSAGVIELVAAHETTDYKHVEFNSRNHFGNRPAQDEFVFELNHEDETEDESESENLKNDQMKDAENKIADEAQVYPDVGGNVHVLRRQEVGAANIGPDLVVSDSGFSSPRNPEADKRTQSSGQSRSASDNSDGHNHEENSGEGHIQPNNASATTCSNGQHTSSDAIMASGSDHHSGSTNDNEDATTVKSVFPQAETQKQNMIARPVFKVKQSHSSNSIKSYNHPQMSQQAQTLQYPYHQSQQLQPNFIHPYQLAANIIPHPDVYNNNTANGILYKDQSRPTRVPLHPNAMLNNQKSQAGQSKRSERPRSVDLWKNRAPNDLHRFEEEQLSKKYGVNGEFEVMGVL